MTDTTYYFHVVTSLPTYDTIVSECAAEHYTSHPTTSLSINTHQSGDEALIKVCCSDAGWKDSRTWLGDVDVYTEPPVALVCNAVWEDWTEID
jgi:hypothetical protein